MDSDIREVLLKELPERLQEIPQPPQKLWVRGVFPREANKYLAVVGSRALTPYGQRACESLIAGLSGYPLSIVSGLALGADACAHKTALKAGLHTIAVLGSGIDDAAIQPRANYALAKEMLAQGGLLLSENQPGYEPRPYDFPKRNRIVAGLSHAVLIIEAAEKSGTLITARLAGEYNRDLLCVPHRISDPHGYGAHLFLRLGATLVSEPSHILEALGIPLQKEGVSVTLEKNEQVLYGLLSEPMSREKLVRVSKLPPSDALTALVKLELKGVLKEELGLWRRI